MVGSLRAAPPGAAGLSDKLLHGIGFALLWPLLQLALGVHLEGRSWAYRGLASLSAASAIGGALEIWQALLPHRSCELLDWVADTVGAAAALALAFALRCARKEP